MDYSRGNQYETPEAGLRRGWLHVAASCFPKERTIAREKVLQPVSCEEQASGSDSREQVKERIEGRKEAREAPAREATGRQASHRIRRHGIGKTGRQVLSHGHRSAALLTQMNHRRCLQIGLATCSTTHGGSEKVGKRKARVKERKQAA